MLKQIKINANRVFDFMQSDTKAVEKLINLSNEKNLTLNSIIDHNTKINKQMLPKKENCA